MTPDEKSGWVRLPWDSSHFGFEIGRILDIELPPANLQESIEAARGAGIQCLYWLTKQHVASIFVPSTLIKVLDTRVEYKRVLTDATNESEPDSIRVAKRQDLTAVLRLAATSHTNTRFYEDDWFPTEQAGSLYSLWIEKATSDPDQVVFVSGPPGQPVAYISCGPSTELNAAAVGLVAVASDQQRQGHGQRLVAAGIAWARKRSFDHLKVVTQGRNVAARRLYERNRFDLVDERTWVHLWLNERESSSAGSTTQEPEAW